MELEHKVEIGNEVETRLMTERQDLEVSYQVANPGEEEKWNPEKYGVHSGNGSEPVNEIMMEHGFVSDSEIRIGYVFGHY